MEIYFAKVLEWLEKIKIEGNIDCDWIGIYFKKCYVNQTNAESLIDLIAGPYIGEDLDHLSIEDQYEHLKKSETFTLIPLRDEKGFFFAEIIITFPSKIFFGSGIEMKTFPMVENYLPFKAISLESPRIILKNLDESDAADIFEFASNPNVARFMAWGPHKNIDDSLRMIRRANLNYEKGWPIPLGIVLKDGDNHKVVGIVGLTVVSAKHRTFELVYALSEAYWGKGILLEASRILIDFSFQHFSINRLQCSCKVENSQSARVMEKLGMKYEGVLRSYMFIKGEYWDLKMYSLLKDDYMRSFLTK